jgi:hypothetical protein
VCSWAAATPGMRKAPVSGAFGRMGDPGLEPGTSSLSGQPPPAACFRPDPALRRGISRPHRPLDVGANHLRFARIFADVGTGAGLVPNAVRAHPPGGSDQPDGTAAHCSRAARPWRRPLTERGPDPPVGPAQLTHAAARGGPLRARQQPHQRRGVLLVERCPGRRQTRQRAAQSAAPFRRLRKRGVSSSVCSAPPACVGRAYAPRVVRRRA